MDTHVGYFAWMRSQIGIPYCEKRDREIHDGKQKDTRKIIDERTLVVYRLSSEEWGLTLDELTAKYPAPRGSDVPSV